MPKKITQTVLIGKYEYIYTEFRDSSGTLTDVDTARFDLYDPEGTIVVDSATPIKESTGVYYYNTSLSTASTTKEGLYQAWWQGNLGGRVITQDAPRYILVRRQAYTVGLGGEIIDDVRRFIGDDDPSDYAISQIDMHYYLADGVHDVQIYYPMGYTITVTPTSITFNKTVTDDARRMFTIGTALVILKHLKHKGLWGAGSIDIGSMRVNMTNINRARASAVKDLSEELKGIVKIMKFRNVGGVSVDTYQRENQSDTGAWTGGI